MAYRKSGQSAFDKFRDKIQEYADAGLSYPEIYDRLDSQLTEDVGADALYIYITKHGIRNRVSKDTPAPNCNDCDHCQTIKMARKSHRVCMERKEMIYDAVKTSPMWCHLRKEGGVVGKKTECKSN